MQLALEWVIVTKIGMKINPLLCEGDVLWGAHATHPWDQGPQVSALATFSTSRVLSKLWHFGWCRQMCTENRNKLNCFILEEVRWDFFPLRVMIIQSVFKHLKVNGSFNNLSQNKAFLGCWGWIGSTEMLCKSMGEAEQCSSSKVCWPLSPRALCRK